MGNEVIIVVPKQLNDEQTRRSQRAELCLWQLLQAAKLQTDPAVWLNLGLLEAEAFLEAIYTGTPHPLIKTHGERVAARPHSRPPPPMNELRARRLVVLALIALQRAGAGKAASRRVVAEQLKCPPLFVHVPSVKVLEHWQDREPPLTPYDEILLARGIARYGIKDLSNLANYFIGLAHATFNPMAEAIGQLP